MNNNEAIEQLTTAQEQLIEVKDDTGLKFWKANTRPIISAVFGESSQYLKRFDSIKVDHPFAGALGSNLSSYASNALKKKDCFKKGIQDYGILIIEMKKYLQTVPNETKNIVSNNFSFNLLCNILRRFNHFVHTLSTERYSNRVHFVNVVEDEYDVQDLMRAILNLHFDNIKPEEPVPSVAGSSSKIDFLLPDENIGIEIKCSSEKRKNEKQFKEEILVDKGQYLKHPQCNEMIFFVYDPMDCIKNSIAFEKDLSDEKSTVIVCKK